MTALHRTVDRSSTWYTFCTNKKEYQGMSLANIFNTSLTRSTSWKNEQVGDDG